MSTGVDSGRELPWPAGTEQAAHGLRPTASHGVLKTTLEDTLTKRVATELLVCGMMTRNCVTHTVISKSAEKCDTTVLADACTTASEMLHLIALTALLARRPRSERCPYSTGRVLHARHLPVIGLTRREHVRDC